ncbi:MAG TPA: hypothetical protein VG347_21465 [Verrucomicrobiae bacterium]|nr:hypothetical protein [Verrucomicrobiae bacterium]
MRNLMGQLSFSGTGNVEPRWMNTVKMDEDLSHVSSTASAWFKRSMVMSKEQKLSRKVNQQISLCVCFFEVTPIKGVSSLLSPISDWRSKAGKKTRHVLLHLLDQKVFALIQNF